VSAARHSCSSLAGVVFIAAAAADSTKLRMLAIYAAIGGVEFVIQAWLLARRTDQVAEAT
jgi:hypothetical protein